MIYGYNRLSGVNIRWRFGCSTFPQLIYPAYRILCWLNLWVVSKMVTTMPGIILRYYLLDESIVRHSCLIGSPITYSKPMTCILFLTIVCILHYPVNVHVNVFCVYEIGLLSICCLGREGTHVVACLWRMDLSKVIQLLQPEEFTGFPVLNPENEIGIGRSLGVDYNCMKAHGEAIYPKGNIISICMGELVEKRNWIPTTFRFYASNFLDYAGKFHLNPCEMLNPVMIHCDCLFLMAASCKSTYVTNVGITHVANSEMELWYHFTLIDINWHALKEFRANWPFPVAWLMVNRWWKLWQWILCQSCTLPTICWFMREYSQNGLHVNVNALWTQALKHQLIFYRYFISPITLFSGRIRSLLWMRVFQSNTRLKEQCPQKK